MPELRTDDGPRKLRAVWLGPTGATLPFEWTYVQWLITLLAMAGTGLVVGGLMLWLTGDVLLGAGGMVLWGWPLGVWLTMRAMRNVSFDEPVGYKARVVRSQLSGRDSEAVSGDESYRIELPPVGHLGEGFLQCVRWSGADQRPRSGIRTNHVVGESSSIVEVTDGE